MELFISYDNKKCKNCKYLKIRKKFFSKEYTYRCGLQISGNLINIESFYCYLYVPKEVNSIDEI